MVRASTMQNSVSVASQVLTGCHGGEGNHLVKARRKLTL